MRLSTLRTTLLGFVSIVLASAMLGSCSSSSNGSGPTGVGGGYGGNIFPKLGSSYTYDAYQTDSLGLKIAATDTTYTATVVQSGIGYHGKTNVFQVSDNGTNNYYTYEQNGDVDLFLDQSAFGPLALVLGNAFNQWYTFPTSSHIKGLIVYDSTVTVPFLGDLEIIGRIDYVGQQSITVGTETFTAEHCVFKMSSSLLFNYQQDFWFVGKIGYFAKKTTSLSYLAIPGLSSGGKSGSVQTLVSYHLN